MGHFWRVDRFWEGLAVLIVAGGESLSLAQVRQIGMAREKDLIRVIAINDAIYPCWFADIAFACDHRWWRLHGELKRFAGLRVSIDRREGVPGEFESLRFLKNTGTMGFDPEPGHVRTGGNGAYQTTHLAAQAGARRVILVAVDFCGRHWFGEHPSAIRGDNQDWKARIAEFKDVAPVYEKLGMDIVNCSTRTQLHVFRQSPLETELARLEKEYGQG